MSNVGDEDTTRATHEVIDYMCKMQYAAFIFQDALIQKNRDEGGDGPGFDLNRIELLSSTDEMYANIQRLLGRETDVFEFIQRKEVDDSWPKYSFMRDIYTDSKVEVVLSDTPGDGRNVVSSTLVIIKRTT